MSDQHGEGTEAMDRTPPAPPQETPPEDPWYGWGAFRLAVLATMLMAANLAAQILAFQATNRLFLAAGAGAAATVLLAAAVAGSRGQDFRDAYQFHGLPLAVILLAALAAASALLPTSTLAELSARLHPPSDQWITFYNKNLPNNLASTLEAYAAVVLLAPLAEEIVFRGIIYRICRRQWGILPAMVISALIFALAHGEPWFLFGLFGLGLLLAAVVEWTGTLTAAVIVHALHNAASLTMMLNEGSLADFDRGVGAGDWLGSLVSLTVLVPVVLALKRRGERIG